MLLTYSDSIRIYGSITHDNGGSGISGREAIRCEYYDILSYDNGFSNLSVNGDDSKIDRVVSYGSLYSGVNVGHSSLSSHRTSLSNIKSYGNKYEGITIKNSDDVIVNIVDTFANERNNLLVSDESNRVKIANVNTYDSRGSGLFYQRWKRTPCGFC